MIEIRWAPPENLQWIAQRADVTIGPSFVAVEALLEGRTVAQVGLDGWCPGSVNMHIALESPIALRRIVRATFRMVFQQLGKRVAICVVKSTNARSLRLVKHLGFKQVFVGRGYWDRDVDMVVFEMRRRDCRYIDQPRNNEAPAKENRAGEAA